MKVFFLSIIALFFYKLSYTQNNSFTVKAGTTINESVPAADLYEYAEFKKGTVFFYN